MRIDVLSLFPEFIGQSAEIGVVGRAIRRGLLSLRTWQIRDFASGVHRSVDDRPYGGGPGMVMMIDPLRQCLEAARADDSRPAHVLFMSPQGRPLSQKRLREWSLMPRLILVCGRYEGVDERFVEHCVDEQVSIGDYVLSGGELAAAVIVDALGRLRDGALGDPESARQDSFEDGLLDCPHYTRPPQHELGAVPEVLGSGDHAAIARWRRQQALGRTWLLRPDLIQRLQLSREDRRLLDAFREAARR
ncbi:tRNA (guanosine(37)-N1)-methyltransferase TrmD [Pseudomarimonas salicorniae]|uniref:tRNA (guanine-N(1)-)-methyltransferase n=1 Tax=Pseudomarimonas salicorniae TaxID=2933270 RepID=A0ABT0GMG1_9GAMM|nr:tRNA (guanosine(37)-N1)-methyltransferase TrmD [Lysobacter sp. CAU 1642]MCK7595562.1 tRNA (guanosine(37)-N1)-methyltransferase TrmD [Lysobacter sp. CAU 1642]